MAEIINMAGTVPETVLKKRKRNEQWEQTKAAQVADKKAKSKDKRKDIFKRAEQYVKEYRQQVKAHSHGCSGSAL